MSHNRLETYLDQVERQMKRLPAWEREAWREEARQHLLALAEAREELGSTPEEAVEASLRQFGEPERLGQELLASSSVARQERQMSGYVSWSLHVLSWNVVVTLSALNMLVAQSTLDAGSAAPAGALFLLGHILGGAVLGRKVRDRGLQVAMYVVYLLMLSSGMALTGLSGAWSTATFLGAWGTVLAGLALGTAAARHSGKCLPREDRPPLAP